MDIQQLVDADPAGSPGEAGSSVVAWIDAAIGDGSDAEVDVRINQALKSIQSLSHSLNEEMENAMEQVLEYLPTVSQTELGRVTRECEIIKGDVLQLEQKLESISRQSNTGAGPLKQLDKARKNMIKCSDKLRSSKSWYDSMELASKSLANGDVETSARTIGDLREISAAISDLPGTAERASSFSSLVSKFESHIFADVKTAFAQGRAAQLGKIFSIFESAGLSSRLSKMYEDERHMELVMPWTEFSSDSTFPQWFTEVFLEKLKSSFFAEAKRCRTIFSDSEQQKVLYNVAMRVLDTIATGTVTFPSLARRCRSCEPPPCLDDLLGMYAACKGLGNSLFDSGEFPESICLVLPTCFEEIFESYESLELMQLNGQYEEARGTLMVGKDKPTSFSSLANFATELSQRTIPILQSSAQRFQRVRKVKPDAPLSFATAVTHFVNDTLLKTEGVLTTRLQNLLSDESQSMSSDRLTFGRVRASLGLLRASKDVYTEISSIKSCVAGFHSTASLQVALQAYDNQVFCNAQVAFEVVAQPVKLEIEGMPAMSTWNLRGRDIGEEDVYGPSDVITGVGERLLALVQQLGDGLEADDGAITLNDMKKLVEHEWKTVADELCLEGKDYMGTIDELQGDGDESFVATWISAVARAVTASLVLQIFRIPDISDHGAKQLVEDISYFENVLSALSVSPPRVFAQAKALLGLSRGPLMSLCNHLNSITDAVSGGRISGAPSYSGEVGTVMLAVLLKRRGIKK